MSFQRRFRENRKAAVIGAAAAALLGAMFLIVPIRVGKEFWSDGVMG